MPPATQPSAAAAPRTSTHLDPCAIHTAGSLVQVDGGLCLPYQEIPFPYSVGIAPVDTTAANIHCPNAGGITWDPDTAKCTDASGATVLCKYPGDPAPTGVAENYGCAAGNPGWPSSSAAEMRTPICKTYVEGCKYSRAPTRNYAYAPEATMTAPEQARARCE